MSSTRNKNQRSEYSLEQKKNEHSLQYLQNKHYSSNEKISFMELGSIPNFRQNELAQNQVDVESMLRGIRSTNLEGPSFQAKPNTNHISSTSWFEKPKLVMPKPFSHSYNERPNYLN
jgi:succinylglutamate desuccinylase